jgi:hypothetical protein
MGEAKGGAGGEEKAGCESGIVLEKMRHDA